VTARGRIARAVFELGLRRLGPLEVIGPEGHPIRQYPGAPRMTITNHRFFDRLGRDGQVGFAEAYMAGEWHADNLPGVLGPFAERISELLPGPLRRLRRVVDRRTPSHEVNSRDGAVRNIARHYDLSNDLFSLFLDDTMTYSCAVWKPGDDLAAAQRRKYQSVAELARLEPGMHVLEIGTGWGGMAMHAARLGCTVTTATISRQQHDLAVRRIAEAGLSDGIDVVLRDYRDLDGRHDAIVSIEMFEAVGEEYWPAYFATCDRLLSPGGRMAFQTITMPHRRYVQSRNAHTWMKKYIFPGGLIPSVEAVEGVMTESSALRIVERREIGHHYVETLQRWRERFLSRADDVRQLGFDHTFVRMWELYLAWCEAGFAARAIGDVQLSLEKQ
jgi:cyclopropane-fatty-acyl-phospholipid synthase